MCTKSCIDFIKTYLKREEVEGKKIIEVGARDVNGSPRAIIEGLRPGTYLGVDIEMGPCVDEVCHAENLVKRYGRESFDVVVSLECLEHIREWRKTISNFKQILRPGGILYLTTRSKNFPYHGFPYDFWRYEIDDLKRIFSDFKIEILLKDHSPLWDGVFIKAIKPFDFKETNLSDHALYSIITKKIMKDVSSFEVAKFKTIHNFKNLIKRILGIKADD